VTHASQKPVWWSHVLLTHLATKGDHYLIFWGWGVDRIWKTPATRESVLGGYFPNNQDYELYDVNVTQESEQCNRLEGSNLDLWEIVRTSDDPMSLQCIGGAKCI